MYIHTVRKVKLPIVNFDVNWYGNLKFMIFEGFISITYMWMEGNGLIKVVEIIFL
jgi:hypothetical protein